MRRKKHRTPRAVDVPRLAVILTPLERELFDKAAKAEGLGTSAWLRRLGLAALARLTSERMVRAR